MTQTTPPIIETPRQAHREEEIREVFIASLILKGCTCLLEIVGGVAFLFPNIVTNIVEWFIRGELIEDPTDFVAVHIQHLIPFFLSNAQLFAAIYLLIHGIIKLFLVINLLYNRLWAYPTTIVVLGLFIVYQLYDFIYNHSIALVLLSVFDAFIIALTWHEYNRMRKFNEKI